MRILTVSAHYPPNFVSGGTLQPQRISRALAALGHEVSVFAGWLGDRPPLDTWTEEDETGLPVTWVASGAWIGWDDPRNWHNAPVTEQFRAHVEELRPDVVHLHSLQSFGAGLIGAAHAAGAKVVVTMHDFWWICARQFLVDLQDRPCSLVVDCGVCACHNGREADDRRRAALATLLAPADVVLAPSASAAAVLNANGVFGGRVEVDENGVPDGSLPEVLATPGRENRNEVSQDPGVGGPVRFLYTGGPHAMKGAAVLTDAVALLAGTGGWSLTAHGLADHLRDQSIDLGDAPVDVRPPFEPDELAGILAAHDVLLLPSVMRETYSIATREALAAGLPVVCTDTLGPEQVVEHGTNGLVVPAADAGSLAAAIASIADDRALLDRLRAGAAAGVDVRTVEDQASDLAARFAALVESPATEPGGSPTGAARQPALTSVVWVCGIDGAPLRYRAHLPADALRDLGVHTEVRHYRDQDLLGLAGRADVVVFYRVPATLQVLELIRTLHDAGVPCAFDVDDLIFDPDVRDEIPALRLLPDDEARLWLEGVNRYRTTLEACDAYIGSTAMLVDHAAKLTGLPTHRFANGVGRLLAQAADQALARPRRPGPVRIGYFSGTTTHDEDWFHVEPAVLRALDAHPDAELWLGGHLPESDALAPLGDRVHRIPFLPWLELPGALRDLDVNLAPLAPGSRFNEAKSAIKWLEAALVATPTIASPTEPFREAIEPGRTGLLADDPDEWAAQLDRLLGDEGLRHRIGALARRHALLEWSPARQGRRYHDLLVAVRDAGVAPRTTDWVDVALDEPPIPVTIEGYAPAPVTIVEVVAAVEPAEDGRPDRFDVLADRSRRLARLAARGATMVREEGVVTTTGKATRKVVRITRRVLK